MTRSYLSTLLASNRKYVLAFSGGLDSTVLLHQLIAWKNYHNLRVLHVHHGLSPHANAWALHCQEVCQKYHLKCTILYVNMNTTSNFEAIARNLRYNALYKELQENECLLTAQHLDDQCETFLLALKRGSGPAGLAAMPRENSVNGYLHIRPLLHFSREEIKKYALQHKLHWIEDESNLCTSYDRNFLRLKIIPLIKARWPSFNQTTMRSATLCADQEQLLNDLLNKKIAKLVDHEGALYFPPLLDESEAYRHALLRRWLSKLGSIMPSYDAVKRIVHEVICSKKDAQPCLRFSKYEIRRYQKKLYLLRKRSSISDQVLIWLDRKQPLYLPENLGQLQENKNVKELRHPLPHEQIIIRFKHLHHNKDFLNSKDNFKIQKLYKKIGIPPWERNRIPLIYYNEKFINIPEHCITTHEGISHNNEGWQVKWIKPSLNKLIPDENISK